MNSNVIAARMETLYRCLAAALSGVCLAHDSHGGLSMGLKHSLRSVSGCPGSSASINSATFAGILLVALDRGFILI